MPTNIFDMTDNWANSSITFDAIKMNVINTASAAGSKLFQLQVGGVSQFAVDPALGVTVGNPTGGPKGAGSVNAVEYFINGVSVGGGFQPLDADLTALSALTGTNTIYYRSGVDTWSPVAMGANMTFAGGVLNSTGGGGGGGIPEAPTDAFYYVRHAAGWTNAATQFLPLGGGTLTGDTILQKASPTFVLDDTGLSGTFLVFTKNALNRWSIQTFGAESGSNAGSNFFVRRFDDGGNIIDAPITISRQNGQVTLTQALNLPANPTTALQAATKQYVDANSVVDAPNNGTRYVRQNASWTSADAVYQPLAAPLTLLSTVSPAANQVPYFVSPTTATTFGISNAAISVVGAASTSAMLALLGGQPIDADLTSLAAAATFGAGPTPSGIYYRKAANTWAPLNLVGLTLNATSDTLTASAGGGGDVFKANANIFTETNYFAKGGFSLVVGHNATIDSAMLAVHGQTVNTVSITRWNASFGGPELTFNHSRNSTIGSHTITAGGDNLGLLSFRGSDGTTFKEAVRIETVAPIAPSGGFVPGLIRFMTDVGLGVSPGVVTRMSIDQYGVTKLGDPNNVLGLNYRFQVHNASSAGEATPTVAFGEWVATSTGPVLTLMKSRGATVGAHNAVIANDSLGQITFQGVGSSGAFVPAGGLHMLAIANPGLSSVRSDLYINLYKDGAGTVATAARFTAASGQKLCGVLDGTAAVSPEVGEYVESRIDPGTGIPNGSFLAVHSMSIPAGDWDLQGLAAISGTAGNYVFINLFTIPNSSSGSPLTTQTGIITGGGVWTNIGMVRVIVSTPTTWYFNMYGGGAGSVCNTAIMTARRRR